MKANDMSEVSPGHAVLNLIEKSTDRLIIAAPYIKSPTIRRLLKVVPNTVTRLICITRWLPEDIASGICDIEIFDDILGKQGGQLFVHPHLHAKYYTNGQQTLVGSANLTSRGLGWHMPSNVELLVTLPAALPGLAEWESRLLTSAIEATDHLRQQIQAQADMMKYENTVNHTPEVEEETEELDSPSLWIPKCPVPERLWEVYRGSGTDTMVSSARQAASDDLRTLSPPQGLNKELFIAYIAGILRQMPLLAELDKLAIVGLTDTKAHEFLADHLDSKHGIENDHVHHWRIVKLWLTHYFPEDYILETGQEVLVKGRKILHR